MIFRRIIHLAVLLFPLWTYGQNEFTIQYRTCTNCDGQLENDNIQFQYGDVQDIQTRHLSSDYGRRNHARAWHYGVDYNLEPADPDGGDHVLAIVGGTVERISGGTGNYKHIRIDADGDNPDFGYGPIWT